MDYDLTRLGESQFERLIQAVIEETFGDSPPAFGAGRGGRNSTFHAQWVWPSGPDQRIWDGETAIQIYFQSRAAKPTDEAGWFVRDVDTMLTGWKKSVRHTEAYLLIVTNAKVPAAQRRAAESSIQASVRELGAEDFTIWAFDDIARLLDSMPEVRRKFSGFIISGDALPGMHEYLSEVSPDLSDTICRDVAMELTADQWVRLTQAGDPTHEKLPLSSVAIDLPLLSDEPGTLMQAASYIVREGNRVLRRGSSSESQPHIVLLGGPGQGKTTIVQLVCQIYREAMLRDASSWIGPETNNLLQSVENGLSRIGIPVPTYWRWPVRVELSAFADDATSQQRKSLLRHIAEKMSSRTSDEIDAAKLRPWLKGFPWLLVLDGFDEVASAGARDAVMERISQFLVDAAKESADLFVVVTTRPQGYIGEFDPDRYRHLTLDSLTPQQASVYAERLAEVRHADDPDMRQKLIDRTQTAAAEDSTARLMRTPLQVTIMALLLEGRERAPQARYALFDAYYETIYAREVAKPGPLGRLLEKQRSHINALHDRIGFLLQVQSEKIGGADALLPQAELHRLAAVRLESAGYNAVQARALADKIVAALTNRLVLIVPKALDDLGFEVRSIQEFMAARALVSGTDESVINRLRVAVPATHWRNTWLLAAGRVFSQREHMHLSLVALLAEVDAAGMLQMVVAPGADLALDLLDDDIASASPRLQRMLALHALTLLDLPPDQDLKRRALVLFRYAGHDGIIRAAAEKAIDQALRAGPARAKSARIIGSAWRSQKGMLSDVAHRILIRPVPKYPAVLALTGRSKVNIADLVRPSADNATLNDVERKKIGVLLAEFQKVPISSEGIDIVDTSTLATRRAGEKDVIESEIIEECLAYPSIVEVIATATNDAATKTWVGASELRNLLRSWLQRRPVGEAILIATPFTEGP
jgi:hypothetical protein